MRVALKLRVIRERNKMKACMECKYEIDVYSRVKCSAHVWHELKLGKFNYVMCCLCGIDLEYINK
jgi:hypothetical protein